MTGAGIDPQPVSPSRAASAAKISSFSRTGATLFLQLVTRRYETASTVLTSNKTFEEWGDIFGDEVMAAALIDRLLHHCHIVNIRGNSFRRRERAELGGPRLEDRPLRTLPESPGVAEEGDARPVCESGSRGSCRLAARRDP